VNVKTKELGAFFFFVFVVGGCFVFEKKHTFHFYTTRKRSCKNIKTQ